MPYTTDVTTPLLQQARDRLADAKAHEAQTRMAWDAHRQSLPLQHAFVQAQQKTREAQGQLDQVERSVAAWPRAMADAQRDTLSATTRYNSLVAANRTAERQAWRQVEQAREAVQRLEADRVTMVGPGAMPATERGADGDRPGC